jgi:hypothetical protein
MIVLVDYYLTLALLILCLVCLRKKHGNIHRKTSGFIGLYLLASIKMCNVINHISSNIRFEMVFTYQWLSVIINYDVK